MKEVEELGMAAWDKAHEARGEDHGDGEHAGERHVCGGGVGKADHADGRGKKKENPARGFCAVDTPGQPGHGESGEKGGERAGKARSSFADAEEFEAESGAPVIEDGLFKPRLAIEARRDPIAGFRHVASNPGVARLVRSDEADGAEIVEIADV